jgi:rod shape-determining protein MreC
MARSSGGNRGRLLLVVLIVSSLLLITLDLRGVSVVSGAKNAVGTALAPVQRVGSSVVLPFKNFFSDLFRLGTTRSTITKLKDENARLKSELLEQRNKFGQAKQLKEALELAGQAQWKVVSAKALSQGSAISFTQTITIDQGTRAGIRPNMTVVNGQGLVGVVKAVFPNSSIVLLASDPSFKIGVRIARTQSIGILSGQGNNQGILELLDNTTKIKAKDVLLARGSSNNRPFVPGVPVGYITKVPNSANYVAQVADVTFYANMNAIGVVSVVISAPDSDPRNALIPKAPVPTPLPTVTIYVTPSPSPTGKGSNT